ncbi:ROK family protein [Paenibacillus montanisoli]|uniref:ROK family protein n=1 Tax=Paenibacillus montanisoli TaxID=2081970 RepID=A0A328TUQ7_9BACL|nr:ROK family protein [Paenibacillus montanisoli]RAP74060.1 hypothetical protein DL346_23585 [Paenibacillus montanisoli]
MNEYAIAFDVGGLFIKSAVLSSHGNVCKDTMVIYPAKAKEEKEKLLEHFVSIIQQQINKINDKWFKVFGIGFAFPGPFDYENGISYIRGIDKFEHIYGVNLREELMERLGSQPGLKKKLSPNYRIVFDNDANLFALGELLSGKAKTYAKSMCVTIGTGTGSAFIEHGLLVKERSDVPENGWIYNTPFEASIIDDYISKRGIMRLAAEQGLPSGLDVKELAELSRSGHEGAAAVFHQFGTNMGRAFLPLIDAFQPEAVIIGGQIAKSHDLFGRAFLEQLQGVTLQIEYVEQTSHSTFVGVSKLLRLAMDQDSEQSEGSERLDKLS